MSNPTALVQKLWNHFNIFRDYGLSFRLRVSAVRREGYYVGHLKFLLLLKMAGEQSRPQFNKALPSPMQD